MSRRSLQRMTSEVLHRRTFRMFLYIKYNLLATYWVTKKVRFMVAFLVLIVNSIFKIWKFSFYKRLFLEFIFMIPVFTEILNCLFRNEYLIFKIYKCYGFCFILPVFSSVWNWNPCSLDEKKPIYRTTYSAFDLKIYEYVILKNTFFCKWF